MPYHKRQFTPGQLQFITASTYRRAPIFLSQRFCHCFVDTLAEARQTLGFQIIGWVLMPDHFHLLLRPNPSETTSLIVQRLKGQSATRIIKILRENQQHTWCQKMLAHLRLPPSVHDESRYRAWQRRFYPFNVYSDEKRLEKLDYMHHNPVKRGLVDGPGDWPWSSWRFYFLQDGSVLPMDRL